MVDEGFYGGATGFRDNAGRRESFSSGYESPGWKRAQATSRGGTAPRAPARR